MVFIGAVGPFEVHKERGVVIISRDGEFHCNLRKSDHGYHDPLARCRANLELEAELALEAEQARAGRLAAARIYIAQRAERAARQFVMEF